MREILHRSAWIGLFAWLCAWGAFAAESRPALVALIEHQGENARATAIMDGLAATMIRNTTEGRYSTRVLLSGELAHKKVFLRTISQLARAGHEVDVMVVSSGSESAISLSRGKLGAGELSSALRPLRELGFGGLRMVYMTTAHELADAWREVGARAVLAHVEGYARAGFAGATAPFFFPSFLARWGRGESLSRAALKASQAAGEIIAGFSRFADEEAMSLHGGVVAPAPVFEGEDLTIDGERAGHAGRLGAVAWPEALPPRETQRHTPLERKLLELLADAFTDDIALRPELMPGLDSLIEAIGEPVWKSFQEIFPGRHPNEMLVPGRDVRIILEKVIPDFNKYMQQIVDQLDSLLVSHKNGKMHVDVWLLPETVRFQLRTEEQAKTGQPYAVDLGKHLHFEISMKRDAILIDRIGGFIALLKLPIVPDGVYPRSLLLDASTEKLTISAGAVKGVVEVVGKADVRAKHFDGIDWMETLTRNLPLILGLLLFF